LTNRCFNATLGRPETKQRDCLAIRQTGEILLTEGMWTRQTFKGPRGRNLRTKITLKDDSTMNGDKNHEQTKSEEKVGNEHPPNKSVKTMAEGVSPLDFKTKVKPKPKTKPKKVKSPSLEAQLRELAEVKDRAGINDPSASQAFMEGLSPTNKLQYMAWFMEHAREAMREGATATEVAQRYCDDPNNPAAVKLLADDISRAAMVALLREGLLVRLLETKRAGHVLILWECATDSERMDSLTHAGDKLSRGVPIMLTPEGRVKFKALQKKLSADVSSAET
jgi:hypothetical protein